MRKERWGKKYKDKRNWRESNEKLVARGEAYISLDFIETWDKDLEKLNRREGRHMYILNARWFFGVFTCVAEHRLQRA